MSKLVDRKMTSYDMASSDWVDEQILHHETQAALLRDIKDKLRELRRIKHEMWLKKEKEESRWDDPALEA